MSPYRYVVRHFQYSNHHPECSIEHTTSAPCLAWGQESDTLISLGYQATVIEEATERRVEAMAQLFHENYERLAPLYNYTTRERSAVPWADLPHENKALMIATVRAVIEEATDW